MSIAITGSICALVWWAVLVMVCANAESIVTGWFLLGSLCACAIGYAWGQASRADDSNLGAEEDDE